MNETKQPKPQRQNADCPLCKDSGIRDEADARGRYPVHCECAAGSRLDWADDEQEEAA